MFLELAEALDCPRCRDGAGLVAFVREARGRRVLSGRLGCPICEIEYPVEAGAIAFGAAAPSAAEDAMPGSAAGEAAVRLAALLGVGERRGVVVLLGPGLGRHGAGVARLAERAEVIAWLAGADADANGSFTSEELEAGVDPILGADPARWPVRSRFLDGVALDGTALGRGTSPLLEEAERCLKSGGRLVLVGPIGAAEEPGEGFRELARDATAWVGERL